VRTLLVIQRRNGYTDRIREGDEEYLEMIQMAAAFAKIDVDVALRRLESGGAVTTPAFVYRFEVPAPADVGGES
jgi:hypothetical protein